MRSSRTGFTIVELLVAAGIVAMLAGLLFPGLLQSRGAARRTACQSNLRQWALAAHLYADVHDGRLPYRGQGTSPTSRLDRADDWFNALPLHMEVAPYIELVQRAQRPQAGDASVWICPEAERIEQPTFFAYGMNMALSTPFMGRPDRIDRVGPTHTMVLMADGLGPYCAVLPRAKPYSPIARHVGETVNIALLDGRVESHTGEEVGCGIGDPQRPDIRWFPPNTRWPGPLN